VEDSSKDGNETSGLMKCWEIVESPSGPASQ
jgi:hypothetical protein